MSNFNKLSSAELERLAVLSEECSEVIQIIGKIVRHGYESHNPHDKAKKTNRKLLEKELGDVRFAFEFMCGKGDIDYKKIEEMRNLKNLKIGKWLHHQET